jgi:hypothetical protein
MIQIFDAQDSLATLLTGGVANNLDELYSVALRSSGHWENENFAHAATSVLGAIILSRELLTDLTIDKLLGFRDGRSALVLERLRCVVQWDRGQSARILHASFSDYLTEPRSCGLNPWFVDSNTQSGFLAIHCLRIMNSQLRFNICKLEDSHILNADVPDLLSRTKECIPLELRYASLFWADHLPTGLGDEILVRLRDLMYIKFLYWLEVLSLLDQTPVAKQSLETLQEHVKVGGTNTLTFWLLKNGIFAVRRRPSRFHSGCRQISRGIRTCDRAQCTAYLYFCAAIVTSAVLGPPAACNKLSSHITPYRPIGKQLAEHGESV